MASKENNIKNDNKKIILASGSVGRLGILRKMFIEPDYIIVPNVPEPVIKGEKPREMSIRVVKAKAEKALQMVMTDKDIDACYEALHGIDHYRIHTFIATSDVHVKDKLKKGFDDVVEMAVKAVKRARNYTDDVEFSCEDAGRTPIDHLCRMVENAIKAGATT